MRLTTAQITLIKRSWSVFRDISPEVIGNVFYTRLFHRHPSLKKLFHTSMDEQYSKLINMFTLIVSRLERIGEIDNDLQQLAVRHAGYGVKPSHYNAVGDALLWTLEQALGSDWNEPLAAAWTACYSHLSETMISAGTTKR